MLGLSVAIFVTVVFVEASPNLKLKLEGLVRNKKKVFCYKSLAKSVDLAETGDAAPNSANHKSVWSHIRFKIVIKISNKKQNLVILKAKISPFLKKKKS